MFFAEKVVEPTALKCTATSSEEMDKFQWMLGDEIIHDFVKDDVEREENEDGKFVYTSSISYEPKMEDNGKAIKCTFTTTTYAEASAKADLKLKKEILPDSPFQIAGEFGKPLVLELAMELAPAPDTGNLQWIIEDKNTGENRITLTPGQTSADFVASELNNLGQGMFTTSLTINTLSQEMLDGKKIRFEVTNDDGG